MSENNNIYSDENQTSPAVGYNEQDDNATCCHQDGCVVVGYKNADVIIPFNVEPDTIVGCVETECCGKPEICCEHNPCENGMNFAIIQHVKIKIPIKIGINTIAGEPVVRCSDCTGDVD